MTNPANAPSGAIQRVERPSKVGLHVLVRHRAHHGLDLAPARAERLEVHLGDEVGPAAHVKHLGLRTAVEGLRRKLVRTPARTPVSHEPARCGHGASRPYGSTRGLPHIAPTRRASAWQAGPARDGANLPCSLDVAVALVTRRFAHSALLREHSPRAYHPCRTKHARTPAGKAPRHDAKGSAP